MSKKHERLGMNPATAAHRLRVDLLFDFAVKAGHVCYRCSLPLTRERFSIEHKESWLSAADPKTAFFDLGNIAFSHGTCNSAVHEIPHKYPSPEAKHAATRPRRTAQARASYTTEARRARYQRTGH